MVKPVVIIHFKPLELYPPVMNLILFLAEAKRGEVIIYSTEYNQNTLGTFAIDSKLISIRRFGFAGKGISSIVRYFQYFKFYTRCLLQLIRIRPDKVLYVEDISSFPAYLYKRYINPKADILVHYHEYTSPDEYTTGMKLSRFFHKKEQWLYTRLAWISHTNQDRLSRFLQDEKLQEGPRDHIMPNYPGRNWEKKKIENQSAARKIVYVGAVSRETMYFENFIDWVLKQQGRFVFDIYSHNISDEDAKWLKTYEQYITLFAGVDYYSLPDILQQYDIGVILYNGHIPNYVINAPNKLFEYLACGLDVWVPIEMTGCQPYHTVNTYPKVLPVDFREINSFDWQKAIDKNGLEYLPSECYYEIVYSDIADTLFSSN